MQLVEYLRAEFHVCRSYELNFAWDFKILWHYLHHFLILKKLFSWIHLFILKLTTGQWFLICFLDLEFYLFIDTGQLNGPVHLDHLLGDHKVLPIPWQDLSIKKTYNLTTSYILSFPAYIVFIFLQFCHSLPNLTNLFLVLIANCSVQIKWFEAHFAFIWAKGT